MSSLFCIFTQPRYQEDVKKDVLKKTFDDNIKPKLSLFLGFSQRKAALRLLAKSAFYKLSVTVVTQGNNGLTLPPKFLD